MATVEVASQAGACFGVQRALDLVDEALVSSPAPVRTLGPLIHNPQVVDELAKRGVSEVDRVPADGRGTLVIRSHGVVPSVMDQAREAGLVVVDATCPFVKKAQHAAERLCTEGYDVVVVGEAGHPEVEGIHGHAPGARTVESVEQARSCGAHGKVGVVVQTTQSAELLGQVVAALVPHASELRVMNTICSATSERQAAAAELAARCDVMVVIGGRNSANTTRLAEICSRSCAATHHIETADELAPTWFAGVARVGVTAGASTPASQIDEVVGRIESIAGEVRP